jgi:SAM-dependent methyltransferase
VTVRDAARGFETAADAYERGRPGYPEAAVDRLASGLGLGPRTRLLDVGAGTGKLSRLVASRGVDVVAVEPAAAMLAKVASAPGVLAVRSLAEALPFRAGAFECAAAASSFHWFDGPSALAELHRVLRAGGRLALLWNRRVEEGWVGRLSAIVNRREGGAPRYRKGEWRRAVDVAPRLFEPVEEAHFPHAQTLTPAGVLDRVASISFIAAMPEAGRAQVLEEVRALLAAHPDTAGRTEVGLAYATDLYLYTRR